MHTWPFPPPSGPIPWTPAQERAYRLKRISETEDAPL